MVTTICHTKKELHMNKWECSVSARRALPRDVELNVKCLTSEECSTSKPSDGKENSALHRLFVRRAFLEQ